jgi:hypothetical protein
MEQVPLSLIDHLVGTTEDKANQALVQGLTRLLTSRAPISSARPRPTTVPFGVDLPLLTTGSPPEDRRVADSLAHRIRMADPRIATAEVRRVARPLRDDGTKAQRLEVDLLLSVWGGEHTFPMGIRIEVHQDGELRVSVNGTDKGRTS